MSKVRRIDWSPSEWLSGTRGLGMDETAVYITVLNIIYDRAGACPNDAGFIAAQMVRSGQRNSQSQSGTTARTRHALGRLVDLGKLHVTPDGQGLTNGRAERELNKARERMRGAAQAGRASGRTRTPSAHPAHSQRIASAHPAGSELSRINELSRTSVRIKQPSTIKDHDTDLTNSTEAAREPSPKPQAAQARAPALPEPEPVATPESPEAKAQRELLAEITAAKRAAFMRGEK
jgi:hypothetical protein